jgi:hypothetical protein
MKTLLLLLLLLPSLAHAKKAATCPRFDHDFTHAQRVYISGDVERAIAELKVLKEKCPASADVERLLSDIYWRQGEIDASSQEANAGFSLLGPQVSSFDDDKLHFADRLHPVKILANVAQLSADHSTGQDYSIEGDARLDNSQHLLFGAYRTSRIYGGDTSVSDTRFEVGHIFVYGSAGYWENNLAYSPTASIYARYGVATTPHWVTKNDYDLFLSFKFNHYLTDVPNASEVVSVTPGFSRPFGDHFAVSLQEIATHSYHWLVATQASVTYLFTNRFSALAGFSTGHVIEGPGLEGDFRCLNLGLKIRLTPTMALVPNEEVYRGSVRNETATGLSLEMRL